MQKQLPEVFHKAGVFKGQRKGAFGKNGLMSANFVLRDLINDLSQILMIKVFVKIVNNF